MIKYSATIQKQQSGDYFSGMAARGELNHNLTSQKSIEKIESKLLAKEQVECPVRHIFGAGVYIREVTIPAGTFSVGHYQKTTHMNEMIKGKVIMLKDDGTTEILEAPQTFVSKPGRKIGLILEDMVWHNIYPTDETDVEILEETYLDKSDTWKSDNKTKSKIKYILGEPDREDFYRMLKDLSVTEAIVREQSENESDQTKMPDGNYKMMVSDSFIQGKGVFATSDIKCGEVIAPARISGKRTPAGRYTNHGVKPNAKMIALENGDINLISTKDISGCHGGELGEEITIDYRQAVLESVKRGELCQE